MSTFSSQFAFLLTITGLFFVPGTLIISAFLRKRLPTLSLFEYTLLSFAMSLSLLDFGLLLLSRIHIPITALSIIGLESIFILLPLAFLIPRFRKGKAKEKNSPTKNQSTSGIAFSHKEGWLFIGLIVLTIFIKSLYLWDTILPTSTDLGHHMFWAKKIALTGAVPSYEKVNIDFEGTESAGDTLTDPQPIDDFIVGEHLPFAATALVAHIDFVSAFPSLILLLVNILTILALSLLSYRLFEDTLPSKLLARRGMIAVLLSVGPLWALSSPEAKYVSGGVVGNLFGNLLIPIIILCFFRALREKNSIFLGLAILFMGTLAFTHHLSTFVFLFIALFILAIFFLSTFFSKNSDTTRFSELREWLALFRSPFPILIALSLLAFTAFVYTPTYLHASAIDTAVGTPSKATREGLSFDQLAQSVGGSRFGLEIIGITILLLSPRRKQLGSIVMIAWSAGLIVMTLFPNLLFIDIPSNRIGTYNTFPAALLTGFAFVSLFMQGQSSKKTLKEKSPDEHRFLRYAFGLFLVAVIVGGFFDNAGTISTKSTVREAVQTYTVSSWLAKNTRSDEWVLKDHNYIIADSWMKLFFMRDYSYPLSRGLFQRYTDETKTREQCTLLMISAPNTPKGQDCFKGTGVDTVVVNPHVDSLQFTKAKDMSLLYLSDDIAVYKRAEK
ncbi:MAG: hypothetical protein IPJ67_00810 [Candidatus Moraniibacteriota bacterium]|nr:MAG: hypothetical protein IPJ67_00810 [Candidatus Moranbacteria bacterium]